MMRVSLTLAILAAIILAERAGASENTASGSSKPARFADLSQAADRARDERRGEDAIRLYRAALKLRPEWQEGMWSLSSLLYNSDRYREARDVLRPFLSLQPTAGLGWAMLGMSEFQTRQYSRALDHLLRGNSLGLGDQTEIKNSCFYHIAILFTRFEQYDEAMQLLFDMVAAGQDQSKLLEPVGLASLRLPLLPAEIPADRRALVRLAGTAALALSAQRYSEAEKLFQQMATSYPDEPGVHFLYGAYLVTVRPEEGIREMRRELEISPSHVPARTRLAEEYLKEEKFDLALPLAQEALKLDPKNVSPHMVCGEVLVAKGDLAAGIRELEAARDLAPQLVRVRWDLMRAYTAAGRKDDAKREKDEIERLSHPPTGQ